MKLLLAWVTHPVWCVRGVRWHRLCERLRAAQRRAGLPEEQIADHTDAVVARRVGELAAAARPGEKNLRALERGGWEILRGWVDELERIADEKERA